MATRKLKAVPVDVDSHIDIQTRFTNSCSTVSAILDLLTHADPGDLKQSTLFDAACGAEDALQEAQKAFSDLLNARTTP